MHTELPDYMRDATFVATLAAPTILLVEFPYVANPSLIDYSEVQKWSRILMEVYPAVRQINIHLPGPSVIFECHGEINPNHPFQ